MKDIGIGLAVIVALLGLTWAIQGNNFFMYQVFAPRFEGARRQVFEQSKAYNDGMNQELASMQFQYEQADELHRAALASIIRHRVAGYTGELRPELERFVKELPR